jgi:transposase, IS5 family
MSICSAGLDASCRAQPVTITVSPTHPLLQLAQVIPWPTLAALVVPDLKHSTAKGKWWRGRKLKLRIHLGAFLLQWLYNLTDRQVEWGLKDNAAYQLFCGWGSVAKWHAPDHTKIEEFRSRLSPETQRRLANEVAVWAKALGFADPSVRDIDSTVQEANIAYPADAQLMRKLAQKCGKVLDFVKKAKKRYVPSDLQLDLAAINRKAKEYFFLAKNTVLEKRREVFRAYHTLVKQQVKPVIAFCAGLSPQASAVLPWNLRRTIDHITSQGWRLLLDVAHFIRTHTIKPGKLLAFHCAAVACIRKGKVGKENEFGRVFQVGRIGGNFLLVGACTSLRMEDAASLPPMITAHQRLWGKGTLRSCGTDKGYYSAANRKYLRAVPGLEEVGLQQPGLDLNTLSESERATRRRLSSRRAGIEPLIGHAKQGGQLGQSRMKSDATTLAVGYGAIGGFNLRQLSRHQLGKKIKPMTYQKVEYPNEVGINLPTA